jgi:hypothetical protein
MKFRSLLILFILLSIFPYPALSSVSGTSSTGILVPLYTTPDDAGWNLVIDAKGNHTNVPFVAIVNPSNGPDVVNCTMSPYQEGIHRLQEKGIIVLGYVYTQWGHRMLSGSGSAEQDIASWKTCYPNINGIFFDEMNTSSSSINYYNTLDIYSKLQNFSLNYVFGNPGQDTSPNFIGAVDTLAIFENPVPLHLADLMGINNWHEYHGKKNFAFLLFNQPYMLDPSTIGNYSNYVNYMYVTDNPGNGHSPYNSTTTYPWNTTSTYLKQLAADLDKESIMLSIRSVNSLGIPIMGYYIQVNQSGNWIPSGFTPLDYNATDGVRYLITANSFANCMFDHWQDTTSENSSRSILVNSTKVVLTAVYKNHNGICL